jgi:hypothetical protein
VDRADVALWWRSLSQAELRRVLHRDEALPIVDKPERTPRVIEERETVTRGPGGIFRQVDFPQTRTQAGRPLRAAASIVSKSPRRQASNPRRAEASVSLLMRDLPGTPRVRVSAHGPRTEWMRDGLFEVTDAVLL